MSEALGKCGGCGLNRAMSFKGIEPTVSGKITRRFVLPAGATTTNYKTKKLVPHNISRPVELKRIVQIRGVQTFCSPANSNQPNDDGSKARTFSEIFSFCLEINLKRVKFLN